MLGIGIVADTICGLAGAPTIPNRRMDDELARAKKPAFEAPGWAPAAACCWRGAASRCCGGSRPAACRASS